MPIADRDGRQPWRLPVLILGGLVLGGILFIHHYGPLNPDDQGLVVLVALLLGLWAILRTALPGSRSSLRPTGLHIQPHTEPLHVRLQWGLTYAYRFAVLYSLYVLVLAALRRSTTFVALGMTLWGVLLTYWIGATLAGLLLGVLQPLTKYRVGAFAVGTLVGLAVYATAMLALPEAHDAPWWLVLIPAVLGGGGLGVVFHDDEEGPAV